MTQTSTTTTRTPTTTDALQVRDLVDGCAAGQMVLAADQYGWWDHLAGDDERMADDDGRPRTIRPRGGVQETVATALARNGWLVPVGDGLALTDAGREIAHARGFLRVVVRGWEPTFRDAAGINGFPDAVPVHTDPDAVAKGCTDIARRAPETFAAVAARLREDPGATIDLGCADAGRLAGIARMAPEERLYGVDLEAGVVRTARARLAVDGLGDRIDLRAGNVFPLEDEAPEWLDGDVRENVTTAMTFFLLHQLASDGGGIAAVLRGWMDWFPNLERIVVGDGILTEGARWGDQPWFAPVYDLYHELTGVRLWWEDEYVAAFAELGWRVAERHEVESPMLVMWTLERAA